MYAKRANMVPEVMGVSSSGILPLDFEWGIQHDGRRRMAAVWVRRPGNSGVGPGQSVVEG
jgi:hypothetical protein